MSAAPAWPLNLGGKAVRVGARFTGASLQGLEGYGRARWLTLGAGDGPRRRTLARVLGRSLRGLCGVHDLETAVRGRVPRGPVVLVANHVSWLDPVILGAVAPCVPIGKAEIAGWPVIGSWVQALGIPLVRRGDAESGARTLRAAWRFLRAGVSVLNFPEGTTTPGQLLRFRRGIFGLARLAGVPIVPVALEYEASDLWWWGSDTFLPHYVHVAARPRTRVSITFGETLDPRASHGRATDDDALAAEARRRVEVLLRPAASAPVRT